MNLPAKYKGITYLVLLLLILPWAVWSFAVRDTFSKFRSYQKDRREILRLYEVAPDIGTEHELPMPDVNNDYITGGDFIKAISGTAGKNKLDIEKYIPYVSFQETGIEITTAELLLTGDYISTIRLMDFIEKELPACRLISADLKSAKDRRTGQIKLTATVLVQQIKTQ